MQADNLFYMGFYTIFQCLFLRLRLLLIHYILPPVNHRLVLTSANHLFLPSTKQVKQKLKCKSFNAKYFRFLDYFPCPWELFLCFNKQWCAQIKQQVGTGGRRRCTWRPNAGGNKHKAKRRPQFCVIFKVSA